MRRAGPDGGAPGTVRPKNAGGEGSMSMGLLSRTCAGSSYRPHGRPGRRPGPGLSSAKASPVARHPAPLKIDKHFKRHLITSSVGSALNKLCHLRPSGFLLDHHFVRFWYFSLKAEEEFPAVPAELFVPGHGRFATAIRGPTPARTRQSDNVTTKRGEAVVLAPPAMCRA